MNYDFALGEWCYDKRAGELHHQCADCCSVRRLEPKVARVFEFFLEHPGEVIGRDELFQAIWGDAVVVDESLTRCISQMRSALGDQSPHRYLETLPKRGYRLVAEVDRQPGCRCNQPC